MCAAALTWEIGIVTGMGDESVDVRNADLIVGTSAGSVVGVELTSGLTPDELFQREVDPQLQSKEPAPPSDWRRTRGLNAAY